jgi:hypothetical protein
MEVIFTSYFYHSTLLGNTISNLLYGGRPGENLPGSKGVELLRRPTTSELELLSAKNNVEFAVMYKLGSGKNGSGGQYYLYSGNINTVKIPLQKDMMFIYHTHPGGKEFASISDQRILEYLEKIGSPQRSSQIVPLDKPVFKFNVKNPNTSKYKL